MKRSWRANALTSLALCAASTLCAPGCDTGSVGISECRELESARCDAAAACGTVDDVDACRRFYHDQCLNGLSGPSEPSGDEQAACLAVIDQAGECAQDDPEQTWTACTSPAADSPSGSAGAGGSNGSDDNQDEDVPNVCDIVASPWQHPACEFVLQLEGMGGAK